MQLHQHLGLPLDYRVPVVDVDAYWDGFEAAIFVLFIASFVSASFRWRMPS